MWSCYESFLPDYMKPVQYLVKLLIVYVLVGLMSINNLNSLCKKIVFRLLNVFCEIVNLCDAKD